MNGKCLSRGRKHRSPFPCQAKAALAATAAFLMPISANAQEAGPTNEESAREVVKRMSEFMAGQPNLIGEFDVDVDIITPALEKIQFAASGRVLLSRPDKVRMIRIGGYTEVELISDGTVLTILEPSTQEFSQMSAPGSVDEVIDMLRFEFGVEMPGSDLLLSNSFETLMANVLEAKHIGVGVIGNVECEHLAFRNTEVDWQLWVRSGDRPLPCKYIISSKTTAGSPEYTIRFEAWTSPSSIPASEFSFSPPQGARPIPFEDLTAIGELPAPAPFREGGE